MEGGKVGRQVKGFGKARQVKKEVDTGPNDIVLRYKEGGSVKGFDVLKGKVKRFPESTDLKVPHMGWNRIRFQNGTDKKSCKILDGVPEESYMYFVHSYYVEPLDKDIIVTDTDYGIMFPSIIQKDNIYATQFHPEKSQEAGLKILENFSKL